MNTNLFVISLTLFATPCFAGPVFGQAAGTEMWTQSFAMQGLYSPHVNDCDSSTEVFLTVGGGVLGFCMEKDDRTAAQFEDARQDCAEDGKRLPEPAEWKYACDTSPTGLIDMAESEDYEWASNFTLSLLYNTSTVGIAVPEAGDNTCAEFNWAFVGNTVDAALTRKYRCVR